MKDNSMTTRSKSVCELYRMWAQGNYAVITIDSWTNGDRATFGGVVLVHSSIGNFGGVVNSCEVPFKQLLAGLDMKGFLSMCGGQAHLTFDGNASVQRLGAAILARRRARRLTAEDACELWGDLQFASDTAGRAELNFRITAGRLCTATPDLGTAADYVVHAASPQARIFWDVLWPEFQAMLRTDLGPEHRQLAA